MANKWAEPAYKIYAVNMVIPSGEVRTVELMRIQLDYVDMALDGRTAPDIEKELNVNEFDVQNWNKEYGFNKYLEYRKSGRAWHNSMNMDFLCELLGKGAMGKIDLSQSQLNSIKMLMQIKGLVGTGATSSGKRAAKIETFTISENDGKEGE